MKFTNANFEKGLFLIFLAILALAYLANQAIDGGSLNPDNNGKLIYCPFHERMEQR